MKSTNKSRKAGTIGIALMLILLLANFASAALQVQSFSCNSQSGTIVVENGGTLTCQATIKNSGSSATNVTSVTLFLDGTWAESTSYTGLGFSSTVSGGATTTATFGNIKPTTPGVHSFSYIRINSVTDTYPSSTSINVIAIKNVALTVPSSNVSAGESFTISASITAGGNLNVVANISLSSCALSSGELVTKNLGAMTDNSVSSASWKITQGSGTCNYNVLVTGSSGAVTVTSSPKIGSKSPVGGAVTTTTIPPTISSVRATNITNSSAIVSWTTDQVTSGRVDYGTSTNYGTIVTEAPTTSHVIALSSLSPKTVYHYRVNSTNATTGLSAVSSDNTFTTASTLIRVINTTAGQPTNVSVSDSNLSISIVTSSDVTGAVITVISYYSNPTEATLGVAGLGRYVSIDPSASLSSSLSSLYLAMSYTDAELTALNINNESQLSFYYYNSTLDTWQAVNTNLPWVINNSVDTTNNIVWANVSHFSIYTIGGASSTFNTLLQQGWNLISLPLQL